MTTNEPVSRLHLERLALGDLPPDEAAALQSRIAIDTELARRALKVRSEIARANEGMPPLDLDRAANVARTAALAPPSLWSRLVRLRLPILVAAGATAALVFVLSQPAPDDAAPIEQFRGSFDLELTLVRDGAARPQGALVKGQPGDRLQWRVTPGTPGWFSAFGVQDDGAVSAWGRPVEVAAMEAVVGAVLLDDYAGNEQVFFVLSDAPVGLNAVRLALERQFDTPVAALERLPGVPASATQRAVLVDRSP